MRREGKYVKSGQLKLRKCKSVIHEGDGILVSSFCLFNSVLLLVVNIVSIVSIGSIC